MFVKSYLKVTVHNFSIKVILFLLHSFRHAHPPGQHKYVVNKFTCTSTYIYYDLFYVHDPQVIKCKKSMNGNYVNLNQQFKYFNFNNQEFNIKYNYKNN